jgi:hypothetical protein
VPFMCRHRHRPSRSPRRRLGLRTRHARQSSRPAASRPSLMPDVSSITTVRHRHRGVVRRHATGRASPEWAAARGTPRALDGRTQALGYCPHAAAGLRSPTGARRDRRGRLASGSPGRCHSRQRRAPPAGRPTGGSRRVRVSGSQGQGSAGAPESLHQPPGLRSPTVGPGRSTSRMAALRRPRESTPLVAGWRRWGDV